MPQYSHESQCDKLEVLSVGNLLSDVINCLCTGKSLSGLSCFEKMKILFSKITSHQIQINPRLLKKSLSNMLYHHK